MKNFPLILVLCLIGLINATGQTSCMSTPPGDSCYKSPFLCGNYLNNYCGSNAGLTEDIVAGNLLQHAGFIRFSPCKDTVKLQISVSNCTAGGEGLSFGLFSGNCPGSSLLYSTNILQGAVDTLEFFDLNPDSTYSLVISGINGSECEFRIIVVEGIGTAEAGHSSCSCTDGLIDGPTILCPGDMGTYTVTLPVCSVSVGLPTGGNGYSCPPSDICPPQDSLTWKWHIPAGTHFIGDSTGLTIQIGLDSIFFGKDTIVMDSIWIRWELAHAGPPADTLIHCVCSGALCRGIIPAKAITIIHTIEHYYCTLTCASPQCTINGVVYSTPGSYSVFVNNCLQREILIFDNLNPPLPPLLLPATICTGESAILVVQNAGPNLFYNWSNGGIGPSITVTPAITTTYFITVTNSSNGCTRVSQVTVTVIPPNHAQLGLVGVLSCSQPCLDFQGVTYCQPGTFTVQTGQCSSITFTIGFDPSIPTVTLPAVTICIGDCYDFFGQSICTDSTATHEENCILYVQQVIVSPQIYKNIGVVGFVQCSQPCLDYQGLKYCTPGIYTRINNQCGIDTFEIKFQKEVQNMGAVGTLTCAIDCVNFEGVDYCVPGVFTEEDSCTIKKFTISQNITQPAYTTPLPNCLPSNNQFTITFSIMGLPPFKVNGNALAGSNYLSVPIVNGTQYAFIIEQSNGCQTVVSGNYDCSELCTNDAGILAPELLEGCSGQSTVTAQSIFAPIGAPGTIIEYWLLDATGTVISQNSTGEFGFDSTSMSVEQTYFIRRIVGTPDSNGHPDLLNACTDTSGIQPVVFHDVPAAAVTSYSPICHSDSTGVISIQLMGGAPPIKYALNDGAFSSNMTFSDLAPGIYTAHVLDGNGCLADTTFTLLDAPPLGLNIGPDLSIDLGDEVTLTAQALSVPVSISWFSNIGLSQVGGIQWTFTPPQSMQVICAMADSIGCVDTASIHIEVSTRYKFDMPNAFTPNGDQQNDIFRPVFRGNIFKEYHLSIYSRWGERLFETFTPGDGWDGEAKGKPQSSDVYLYIFDYQMKTGEKGTLKKELTMLR